MKNKHRYWSSCCNRTFKVRKYRKGFFCSFCKLDCDIERKPFTKLEERANKKKLGNQLWSLVSEYIRRRDNGVCFTCGDTKDWTRQQAGHCFGKKACPRAKYEEINLACQCARCNMFNEGEHARFILRLINKFGIDEVTKLEQLAYSSKPLTLLDLDNYLKIYTKKLNNLL